MAATPSQIAVSASGYVIFAFVGVAVMKVTAWYYRDRLTYRASTRNLWDGVPEERDAPSADPIPRWYWPVGLTVLGLVGLGGTIALIVAACKALF
jgi:hypothetical protein